MRWIPDPMAAAVAVPLAGALLVTLLPKRVQRLQWAVSLVSVLGTVWAVCRLVALVAPGCAVRTGEDLTAIFLGPLVVGRLDHFFEGDRYSAFLAVGAALVVVLIVLHMEKEEGAAVGGPGRFAVVLAGLGGLNLVFFAAGVTPLLVGWGLLTGCLAANAWRVSGGRLGAERGLVTFALLGLGDLLLLVAAGAVLYCLRTGAGDPFVAGPGVFAGSPRTEALFVAALLAAGLSKCGVLLFSTWFEPGGPHPGGERPVVPAAVVLPMVFGVLPGVYLISRLTWWIYGAHAAPGWLPGVLTAIGLLSAVVAGVMSLAAPDLGRFVVLQGICRAGLVLAALACGNPAGLAGGVISVYAGLLCLTGLAMVAWNIAGRGGVDGEEPPGPLWRKMPVTASGFVLCGLGLACAPPFGSFISRWLVLRSFVEAGSLTLVFAALLVSLVTVVGLVEIGRKYFLSVPGDAAAGEIAEAPAALAVPPVLLGLLCLVLGMAPFAPGTVAAFFGGMAADVLSFAALTSRLGLLAIALLVVSLTAGVAAAAVRIRQPGQRVEGGRGAVTALDTAANYCTLQGVYRLVKAVGGPLAELGRLLHNGSLSRYAAYALLGLWTFLFLVLVLTS